MERSCRFVEGRTFVKRAFTEKIRDVRVYPTDTYNLKFRSGSYTIDLLSVDVNGVAWLLQRDPGRKVGAMVCR